jgi:hypothetical protein
MDSTAAHHARLVQYLQHYPIHALLGVNLIQLLVFAMLVFMVMASGALRVNYAPKILWRKVPAKQAVRQIL